MWAGFLEELKRTADSMFEWHHCMVHTVHVHRICAWATISLNQAVCYATPVSLFSVEDFRMRFRNVEEVTEFSTLLEHIKKGVISYMPHVCMCS